MRYTRADLDSAVAGYVKAVSRELPEAGNWQLQVGNKTQGVAFTLRFSPTNEPIPYNHAPGSDYGFLGYTTSEAVKTLRTITAALGDICHYRAVIDARSSQGL